LAQVRVHGAQRAPRHPSADAMSEATESGWPQFMSGRYDICEKNTFLDFPAPKPLPLEKAQTDPPPGLEGICGASSKFISETDRSEDSTAADEAEAPPPLPLENFVTPDCFEDPDLARFSGAPPFIPMPGLPMPPMASLPGIPDIYSFEGQLAGSLAFSPENRPKKQISLEEMLGPSVVPVTGTGGTPKLLPPPPAMPAPVLAEPEAPEVPSEPPDDGPRPPESDLLFGQVLLSEPATGVWDVHWCVDGRQLYTTTVRLVSSPFQLELPGLGSMPFKVFLHPKEVINSKRGGGFKKAKGKGSIVLKCEAEDARPYPKLQITFRVGRGARLQPVRSEARHDFSEQSCCCLPEAEKEWDFRSFVEENSQALLVSLRIVVADSVRP